MSISYSPDHLMSLREWDELPDDEPFRVEVAEGVLIVSPRPAFLHQRAANRLVGVLDDQLPDELSALGDVEVLIEESPLTVRCPDVVVVNSALVETNPPRTHAAGVHLVVEVLSEGSVRTDRVMKFSEYADAGIAQYWIVDPAEPVTLTAFALTDSGYERAGEYSGSAALEVGGHPVTVDLAALTTRRG